ncbi:hypothetical protein Hamer_G012360 [Homarus americanus]|uniref:Uncharacterized protein n=1 Tax=Homarus americanus TaxID=6706 RepID=A0A8J5N0H2_HOMAM|nr:hypothetical protein Hamer_G012360 [Homarus americanus]
MQGGVSALSPSFVTALVRSLVMSTKCTAVRRKGRQQRQRRRLISAPKPRPSSSSSPSSSTAGEAAPETSRPQLHRQQPSKIILFPCPC